MKNKLYFDISKNDTKTKENLFHKISKEREDVGYYSLPSQDISEILEYASSLDEKIEHIAVIGIGGSSLGIKAIYEFLRPTKRLKKELTFFESTDPISISHQLAQIDIEKTHFIIISKSGTTIETIAVFKYILSKQQNEKNYTIITDDDSPLSKLADKLKIKCFFIPSNVGGRFSALSNVGLMPLSLCGVNIKDLLSGADKVKKSFFEDGFLQNILMDKALFYAKNHAKYHINCIFAYSETLEYFCEWYVQLWGESLGKKQKHSAFNVGLTPVGLIGPKDQHSFLQLLTDGTRDKSATFIKIDDFKDDLTIPDISLPYLESLDILNGVSFHDLINMQCDATMEALINQNDIPVDKIKICKIDEFSIGSLIFYYELLTSLVGQLIDVNTYDQPGVEYGKILLKDKLLKLKGQL